MTPIVERINQIGQTLTTAGFQVIINKTIHIEMRDLFIQKAQMAQDKKLFKIQNEHQKNK